MKISATAAQFPALTKWPGLLALRPLAKPLACWTLFPQAQCLVNVCKHPVLDLDPPHPFPKRAPMGASAFDIFYFYIRSSLHSFRDTIWFSANSAIALLFGRMFVRYLRNSSFFGTQSFSNYLVCSLVLSFHNQKDNSLITFHINSTFFFRLHAVDQLP